MSQMVVIPEASVPRKSTADLPAQVGVFLSPG